MLRCDGVASDGRTGEEIKVSDGQCSLERAENSRQSEAGMLMRINHELLLMWRRSAVEEGGRRGSLRSSRPRTGGRDELSRRRHPCLLLSEGGDGEIVDLSELARLGVLGVLMIKKGTE